MKRRRYEVKVVTPDGYFYVTIRTTSPRRAFFKARERYGNYVTVVYPKRGRATLYVL